MLSLTCYYNRLQKFANPNINLGFQESSVGHHIVEYALTDVSI